MELNTVVVIAVWGASIAALGGQSWANTRALKQRQDDTNNHLILLNGKTFDSHREIGQIMGSFNSLPCRNADICPIETDKK